MGETLQHLVLIRHGESEGDVRRAAWRRGEVVQTDKMPEEEELTARGEEECRRAGRWIIENIMRKFHITQFDGYYVSSALRSEQSAIALDLPNAVWQVDANLDERNRGFVRGIRAEQHKKRFPDSYAQMKSDPLHWVPPGGNAIKPTEIDHAQRFLDKVRGGPRTVVAVTHRDKMWAAMAPLEGLDDAELLAVNTDDIHNAQVVHYTSVDPISGEQAPALLWVCSVDPMHPDQSAGWQYLSRLDDSEDLAS